MIVSKGLGRGVAGVSGIISATGLGLFVIVGGEGSGIGNPTAVSDQLASRAVFVDYDSLHLLEIIPIIVEVLNGQR